MRCPYCGVNYTDGERQCPICGKRAPLNAPKKKKTIDFGIPRESEEANYTAKSTEQKQTYRDSSNAFQDIPKREQKEKPDAESAWQRAARGEHSHGNPLEPKKKNGCGIGCLIVVIVFIVISILGSLSFDFASSTQEELENLIDSVLEETDGSHTDDTYQAVDMPSILNGIWKNSDASLSLTIDNGVVSWKNADGSFTTDSPTLYQLHLTEDNILDYLSEDLQEKYPLSQYTYYDLTCWGTDDSDDDDEHYIEMILFVPQDAAQLYSFDYYDCDTYKTNTMTKGGVRSKQVGDPSAVPAEQST